jgi:fido (protein-threonine AMPylation protein)
LCSTKSKHNDVSKNRTHSEIENSDRKSTKSKHDDVSKNRTHSEIENCVEKEAKYSRHTLCQIHRQLFLNYRLE